MRESRSSGSVGERGGNEPLYPDCAVQNPRGGDLKANRYKFNETPLRFPAGNQSCPVRISQPPEASLA